MCICLIRCGRINRIQRFRTKFRIVSFTHGGSIAIERILCQGNLIVNDQNQGISNQMVYEMNLPTAASEGGSLVKAVVLVAVGRQKRSEYLHLLPSGVPTTDVAGRRGVAKGDW